ncbi:MAG: DNA-binding HxlR family transcriptional regulator [Verrucomicrobiales bacterium]|jgi:DNA-binding HxlR family transcriptional regulator
MPSLERRSPCPVSCTLDILGDKWSLLVVRDLLLGHTRFKEFAKSPEGIPTNILTERLLRLEKHNIVEKRPIAPGIKRHTYHLTEKGEGLRLILRFMMHWGLKFEEGTQARMKRKT